MKNILNFKKLGFKPLVCVAIVCFQLLSSSSFAQFSGGNGSQNNPYIITTATELAQLATFVNVADTAYNDKYYKLGNNINLSAYGIGFNNGKGWIPIGKYRILNKTPFKGGFDGDSNTITGLYINDSTLDGAGLFGNIEGVINNLNIDSVTIIGGVFVGGITGYVSIGGSWRCSSSGSIVGQYEVGGIVGRLLDGNISNCYSSCNVSGLNATSDNIGGIAGWVENGCRIANCYSVGTITGHDYIGGIVGMLSYASLITDCYSLGNITGNQYVGGIAGYVSGSSVRNCYSVSNIIASKSSGGILGEVVDALGCLKGQIINNIALNPSVKGENNIGRVMGVNDNSESTINNTAYDSMLNSANDILWVNKAVENLDGEDIGKQTINADGTLGGKFTSSNGWTTQNGKLPGLFGKAVEMPEHLQKAGQGTTGIAERDNSDIRVYPNPTTGELKIESVNTKIDNVEVYDIAGKLVQTHRLNSTTNAILDVSTLANGTYLVNIYSEGQKTTKKFVKE